MSKSPSKNVPVPRPNTAVIYCRVSSKKQADGISIPFQEEKCREVCAEKGLEVIQVFRDTYSGRTISRDWLNEMFKFVQKRRVGYCYTYQIDRISRWESEVHYSIKATLIEAGVLLRDQEWILRDSEIRIKEIWWFSLEDYEWNRKRWARTEEAIKVSWSADDIDEFLWKTIPKEVYYTQNGLHQRESLFGYQNVRQFIPELWIKGTIQIPHPIESPFIRLIYELRAEWTKSDEEIANELNRLWYLSRPSTKRIFHQDGTIENRHVKGIPMTAKRLQVMVKYTKYAWVVCEKWTNDKPIKAKYAGLVSIETFNRANRGEIRIEEKSKTGEIEIFYKNQNTPDILPEKRPRSIHRPDFVYRKVVFSPYWEVFPKGSFSKGRSGKLYANYHCVVPFEKARQWIDLPEPTKTGYSFNCPKDIFENVIFRFFDAVTPEPVVIDFFVEYVDSIWQKHNEREETSEEQRKRKKNTLEKQGELLLFEIERLATKEETLAIKLLLDKKNKEFNEIHNELATIDVDQPIVWLTDREKFKAYARLIMTQLSRTVRSLESEQMAKVLFDLVFERPPHYDELSNFTAPIFPVFRLNEALLKNSGRTDKEAASTIGKHYTWKPKSGTKSKAVSIDEKSKSRTKNIPVSSLIQAKKEDPPFGESSDNLWWQPQ